MSRLDHLSTDDSRIEKDLLELEIVPILRCENNRDIDLLSVHGAQHAILINRPI
jgi:hypothetical protein